MADLLKRGLAWLAGKRKANMAHTVTFRRGGSSVELDATVGQTKFDQEDSEGRLTQVETRDYLVTAADLILDGSPVEPRPGDEFVETLAGVPTVFRVMDLPGRPCFDSDPYRTTLRIHTKDLGGAEP